MILSSADILKILGGNEIIRLSATVSIVDGKPALSGREGVYIYINRFPLLDEFEATWTIWIEADEDVELIIAEVKRVLPSVKTSSGLMTMVTTTDFRSDSTQRAPEAPKAQATQVDLTQYEERFQSLVEDVQDQMLLVTSGRPGKDGKDGLPGAPGRDGKDIDATNTNLEDLANVEQGIVKENGQVLTWKDGVWQNLFIPQVVSSSSGGAQSLNDLTDVDASAPNNGNIISYNSASGLWEVAAAPPADISGNSIGDLSDVTIDPALLEKDFGLVYDGTEWVVASPPVLVDGHNRTGSTIPKGTPVYVEGTHNSGKPLLGLADANGSGNAPAIGLTHEEVVDGIDGHVMLSGILTNVDTSVYSAGDALYLSTTPGVLTNVRPTAANEKVQKVGLVTRVHATAGSILIIGAGRTNDINNELVALIGAGDRNAVDLGTFSGSTITDNVDIKTALQELEAVTDVALQSGDNISELVNDVGYITLAEVPADAVTSVNGQTGAVVLGAADVGAATAAQGALADSAVQSGDNVSDLTNDAGYITLAEVPADRVQSVNGEIGVVVIDADDIPTTGTVNKFTTTADINKLAGIETGAQVNEVEEAPQDGNYYVRQNGAWVNLATAINDLTVNGGIFT